MRGVLLVIVLVLALFALLTARPVRITQDNDTGIVLLWGWQEGEIQFINSVTHQPVLIRFGFPWRFSGFHADTDSETANYYTAGVYSWNDRLSTECNRSISYCSEVGVTLRFGQEVFREKGGCIHASLLWPP